MNGGYPLISIIILNYNQTDITCEFLESTRNLTYPNFETIVIDNASKISPKTQIEAGNYPNIKLLENELNLGFTGGNNLGIRLAKGEYIFVVNNDTEVTPNLLDILIEPFRNDPSIGVVSPKIRYFEQPDTIQYAGYNAMNLYTGRARAVGSQQKDIGQHDQSGYTNFAHGAAMLVKRSVLEEVGLFPDFFFIYYEELDLSTRILDAGYKIYYQAQGLIFHKESITMGKESAIKAYYHTRNRIAYIRRNSSGFQNLIFYLFLSFFIIPKATLKYVTKGQKEHLRAFFKGVRWHFSTSNKEINTQTVF